MDRLVLKKRLGQHHLRDTSLCRPLVDFLAPAGRLVVEIGAGGGVLTTALLDAQARVLAWELDPAWALRVAQSLPVGRQLHIVCGDALELPWHRLPVGCSVAGNLPYNVATPLIDRLLSHGGTVERAGVLVQLEVAERLVAEPGSKAYGAFSVLVQARAEARLLARVRPGSFVPPPRVESAFVGLELRPWPGLEGRLPALRELVYAAFGQRRKTLRNALASRWPVPIAAAAIEASGLAPAVRAEQLAVVDFVELLDRLQSV